MGAFDVRTAADFLRSELPSVPRVSVVLGSGLGQLVEGLSHTASVAFEDVPGFPPSRVEGHAARFVVGRLGEAEVLFQCGRYHLYEGHPPDLVVAPVRVAARLGVQVVVFTNAGGAIRPTIEPGDLVLLDDHINAMFRSPLLGPVQDGEARFPDMSTPYDSVLQQIALDAALDLGIILVRGTYAGVLGPAYETAAEVRMLGRLGADVVGMSTVPEVIAARALGVRCLGFTLVTNKATGLGGGRLAHEEVIEVGRDSGGRLGRLLAHVIPRLQADAQSTSTR